jgi:hypothetical protein
MTIKEIMEPDGNIEGTDDVAVVKEKSIPTPSKKRTKAVVKGNEKIQFVRKPKKKVMTSENLVFRDQESANRYKIIIGKSLLVESHIDLSKFKDFVLEGILETAGLLDSIDTDVYNETLVREFYANFMSQLNDKDNKHYPFCLCLWNNKYL